MPLYKEITHSNNRVLIWKISETEKELSMDFSNDFIISINKNFKLSKRRIEKLTLANLLRLAEINHSQLQYTPSGKPYILSSQKNMSFSHSGEFASLLISTSQCGIDIQKDNSKIQNISSKFLNDEEKLFLNKPDALNWIWSIKEAVFKYFGQNVIFKEDMIVCKLDLNTFTAQVNYKGVHGLGIFDLKLEKIENYYLAFTIGYNHL